MVAQPPLQQAARLLGAGLILGLSIASVARAQPDWVKEAARDAEAIAPHRDAGAVILFNTADVVISTNGHATTHVRTAAKIIKESGKRYATLTESVAPYRKIEDLKGWRLSPDGKARSLKTEKVFEIDQQEAVAHYDDARLLVAELEDVQPGDIAAFEYTIEKQEWTGSFQAFEFQNLQPVRLARFSLEIPGGWKIHRAEWRTEGVTYENQGTRHVWMARNLPYEAEEPLIRDGAQIRYIAVSCIDPAGRKNPQFSDWVSVARWVEQVDRGPSAPDAGVTACASQVGGALKTPGEKLRALAAFVQNDIRYVAVEIGAGRWEPRAASVTLRNRYGDCKDKTVLLRALLQAAGIPSISVLVNPTHSVQPDLPSPWQFNHAIIGIPGRALAGSLALPNATAGEWLLFDPTDPTTPLGELPGRLQGGMALAATEEEPALLTLPYCPPEACRRRYCAEVQLAADGSISVHATVVDLGSWATESRYEQRTTSREKQIENWRERISVTVPTAVLSDFQAGSDADSTWVSFELTADRYLTPMGQLTLLKPDIFRPAKPPVLTRPDREHAIWFGAPFEVETILTWHLPGIWTPESPIAPIESTCGGASVSCSTTVSGNTLLLHSVYRSTGRPLPASEYESARRVSRDLSAVQGFTTILKASE